MTLVFLAVAWLLTYLLHSTILLGGGWLLTSSGAVRTPAAKDTLWKVCLVGGLLTASVQVASKDAVYGRRFWLPGAAPASLATPASAARRPAASAVARDASVNAPRTPAAPSARRATWIGAAAVAAPSASTSDPQRTTRLSWPVALLVVWMLGAAALLTRLAVRRTRFVRRLRDRRTIGDGAPVAILESLRTAAGVRRRVRLAVSTQLSGPVAMGTSEICLPVRALDSLSAAEQRAVLAHELGHLVRRDPSWLAVAVAVESVLFLQPLNRLARRRLQEAAEYLCDDWAVSQTGGSLTLAKCLAEVATWVQASRRAVPVSGMAENRSHLVERVHRLLEGVEPRAVRGVRFAVPAGALALATVAFAAPGVRPPSPVASAAATSGSAAWPAPVRRTGQGTPQPWATIRDGRLIVFRSGFAPRITGQGRLGIRRGGRAIELMDDQQPTVNGRPVADDATVSVSESDTLRIVDAEGSTVWSLVPVRVAADDSRAAASAAQSSDDEDDSADMEDMPEESVDTAWTRADDLDAAELVADSRDLARLGTRLGRDIAARIAPDVARIQTASVRAAAEMAPQLAELGEQIGATVGSAIAEAFGDSAACDSAAAKHASHLRRGINGKKHLR